MARPRGSKNRATLLRMAELGIVPEGDKLKQETRTREEIIADIEARFEALRMAVAGATKEGQGIIASGAPGIGKTHNTEMILKKMKEETGRRYQIMKTKVSPIELYRAAYEHSAEGETLVLDDADTIFSDESGLNLLKSLLDSGEERLVTWYTQNTGEGNGNELPSSFIYHGSMIFLTNKNFREYIDRDVGANVEHMKALMTRARYLDMKMHRRSDVAMWSSHIVRSTKLLRKQGLSEQVEAELLAWMEENNASIDDISIRGALKLARTYKEEPGTWKQRARMWLMRD